MSIRTKIIKDKGYTDDYDTLWLKPGAPKEVIEAAYRALSRLYHPDRGGDTKAQAELNAAYRRLMDRT